MYDTEDESWFGRHRGAAFGIAVGLTFVVPLFFMVGVGAIASAVEYVWP